MIEARGARGGASGGLGAKMFGHFYLNSGSNLKILVGQEGSTLNTTGGGGGGTFVVNGTIADGILLVAAGGGGGADRSNLSSEANGKIEAIGGIAPNNYYNNSPGSNGNGSNGIGRCRNWWCGILN